MFKLSKLIATGIFSTLLAFPLTTKAEQHPLIGVNYPPLPEKLEKISGCEINVKGLRFKCENFTYGL